MSDSVTKKQVISDLRALGVKEGDHLNVKASLKSIGHLDGGPNTLIDALLEIVGEQGTIFSDSFVDMFRLPLSKENEKKVMTQDTPSYAGAVANAMVKHPKSFRSPHPVQKFVGIGYLAEELTQNHTENRIAYELLGELAARGGRNLKIGSDMQVPGVGTTHVAIERLNIPRKRERYGVMYETATGKVEFFEINWSGGCATAWLKFYPIYEEIGAIIGSGKVGRGPGKLTDMGMTLAWELDRLKQDPSQLLCGRETCKMCALEWDFSHNNKIRYLFFKLLEKMKKN